jgi:hypothetical protein
LGRSLYPILSNQATAGKVKPLAKNIADILNHIKGKEETGGQKPSG